MPILLVLHLLHLNARRQRRPSSAPAAPESARPSGSDSAATCSNCFSSCRSRKSSVVLAPWALVLQALDRPCRPESDQLSVLALVALDARIFVLHLPPALLGLALHLPEFLTQRLHLAQHVRVVDQTALTQRKSVQRCGVTESHMAPARTMSLNN